MRGLLGHRWVLVWQRSPLRGRPCFNRLLEKPGRRVCPLPLPLPAPPLPAQVEFCYHSCKTAGARARIWPPSEECLGPHCRVDLSIIVLLSLLPQEGSMLSYLSLRCLSEKYLKNLKERLSAHLTLHPRPTSNSLTCRLHQHKAGRADNAGYSPGSKLTAL